MSYVDGWRTFVTKCKLNCRSYVADKCIVAMILGLRQALTQIGCLQAFESGPAVEEPCLVEVADYDQVYYDSVTGASLPSKSCEEAMQLEIKYVKEMNVYTPCEHGAVREQGLTPIGTRCVFTNKDDTEHPFIHPCKIGGCSGDAENDEYGFDGHFYDTCCDPPVEGFRCLLSRAITGEKRGTHRMSWS